MNTVCIGAWCGQADIIETIESLGLKHLEIFETNLTPFEVAEMIYTKGFNVMISHDHDNDDSSKVVPMLWVDDRRFSVR